MVCRRSVVFPAPGEDIRFRRNVPFPSSSPRSLSASASLSAKMLRFTSMTLCFSIVPLSCRMLRFLTPAPEQDPRSDPPWIPDRSSYESAPPEHRLRSAARRSSDGACWMPGFRQQVRASATWVSMAPIFSFFMKLLAASLPPLRPKETTPQLPWGRYFFASSWYLLPSRSQ